MKLKIFFIILCCLLLVASIYETLHGGIFSVILATASIYGICVTSDKISKQRQWKKFMK